jgi:DNA-directed RNA polymerase subunit H (RpoH/RPB5)
MASKFEYGSISRLYNSRKTYISQLKDQGYNVEPYESFSINEVNIMVQNKQQDMLIEHPSGNKIYVLYHVEKALRPQNIHDMIDDLFRLEKIITTMDTLTIIAKDSPNDTLTNLVMNIYANENIFINILYLDQLQFNVLEHSLVPVHKKLTSQEADEVRKNYNIKHNSELPEISRFDPPAQILGMRPGDICHIIRPSKISVTVDNYRICVNKSRGK